MKILLSILVMLSPGIKWLDANFATYDALQKRIHAYAEPGYLETKSSEAIAVHLEENGFTVERGVAGIPTAFIATYGSGSPVIGLLGEYDALKGMSQDTVAYKSPVKEGAPGHACGHNLLGTATASAAVAISKWLAEGHEGTVRYFGCPAEEGGGGKYYMTREGCFDGCDVMFDWHPGQSNCVPLSPWLANMRVNFTFTGTASHAGSAPWNGRSALDGVEAFDFMMNMMREHVPDGTRIHYIISNGGQAPNVVPEKAQAIYYFRAPKAAQVQDVFNRAVKAAEGAALGTGTRMDYEIINACYERLINRRLAEVFLRSLRKSGGTQLDARESEFALAVQRASGVPEDLSCFTAIPTEVEPPLPGGASTDVGNVSQMVPLANLCICTVPAGAGGAHSWQQTAVGGSTVGTKCLMTVARTFYWAALELFTNPSELRAIREEFESVRGKNPVFEPLMDRQPPLDFSKDSR